MTEPENAVPEEPDLGAAIQLESGETLDGPPGTDAMEALYVAPNKPFGLDDPAVTPEGQRRGDTLDERLTREVPDDLEGVATAPDPTAADLGSEALPPRRALSPRGARPLHRRRRAHRARRREQRGCGRRPRRGRAGRAAARRG